MSGATTRLGLVKPLVGEEVDVDTQYNANLDLIDLNVGFRSCTSSTRPSVVWSGLAIFETDTGKTLVSNGSAPASGSWTQLVNLNSSIALSGANNLTLAGSATTVYKELVSVSGDGVERLGIRSDGLIDWGSGALTRDTNLYRSAANTLKTDDSFVIGEDLTVTDDASVLGDLSVSGAITVVGTITADVETTTTGLTAATGFSTPTLAARRTCGVVSLTATITRTGATITGTSSGNITDTLAATLPAGWVPADTVLAGMEKGGVADGSASILSDGTITLKTLSPTATIASGDVVTITATFVA